MNSDLEIQALEMLASLESFITPLDPLVMLMGFFGLSIFFCLSSSSTSERYNREDEYEEDTVYDDELSRSDDELSRSDDELSRSDDEELSRSDDEELYVEETVMSTYGGVYSAPPPALTSALTSFD